MDGGEYAKILYDIVLHVWYYTPIQHPFSANLGVDGQKSPESMARET